MLLPSCERRAPYLQSHEYENPGRLPLARKGGSVLSQQIGRTWDNLAGPGHNPPAEGSLEASKTLPHPTPPSQWGDVVQCIIKVVLATSSVASNRYLEQQEKVKGASKGTEN